MWSEVVRTVGVGKTEGYLLYVLGGFETEGLRLEECWMLS